MTASSPAGLRRGRVATTACALVGAVGLAACGVQSDDQPRALAAEDVPFSLLEPDPAVEAPADPSSGEGVDADIYLLGSDGQLVEVARTVPSRSPADLIRALLADVPDNEAARNLGTAIPSETELLGLTVGTDDSTVLVDLSEEFTSVQGARQIAAVAQVVFTLTGLRGVDGVRFAIEGEVRAVPRGDGDTTDEPLTRAAFDEDRPSG